MSTYLRNPNAFEEKINRGVFSHRSPRLNNVVAAVKTYIQRQNADNLREIRARIWIWRQEDPGEFRNRYREIATDMHNEMCAACERFGMPAFEELEEEEQEAQNYHLPPAPPPEINRHRRLKWAGKAGLGVSSVATQVVSTVTHAGVVSVAASSGSALTVTIGGTALASATGVGALVVGGAAMLTTSTLAAKSAYKTYHHVQNLEALYRNKDFSPYKEECYFIHLDGRMQRNGRAVDHDLIANHVLPYIIHKKSAKFTRKVVSAVPGIGLLESARALTKWTYKKFSGTQGVHRRNAARWLASHFTTCQCTLTEEIVAELCSLEVKDWLKFGDVKPEDVVDVLALKMQST